MDIKELEDIVSQLSSEVSKTSTSFSSFRSEAKKNDNDLFNISRDVYSTLKSNKNSISSIEEDVQEIKDNSLLIRNSFGELKNKQETIQFNLNEVKTKQDLLNQNLAKINTDLETVKSSINYRLNSLYTSLENRIIEETRRKNSVTPERETPVYGSIARNQPQDTQTPSGQSESPKQANISRPTQPTQGQATVNAAGGSSAFNTAANIAARTAGVAGVSVAGGAAITSSQSNISAPSSQGSGATPSIGTSSGAPNVPVQGQDVAKIPNLARTSGGIDRSKFYGELQNPETRQLFYQMMHAEVGSQGKESQVAFAETVFNRAHATNRSLKSILSDRGYYQPYRDGGFARAGNALAANPTLSGRYASVLGEVAGGSNTTQGATHNASGSVAASVNRGGYDAVTSSIKVIGGETYYSKTFEQRNLQTLPTIKSTEQNVTSAPQSQPLSQGGEITRQQQLERPFRIQGQAILPQTSSFQETRYDAVTGGRGRGSMSYGVHNLQEQQGGAGRVIRNYLRNINDPTGAKNVVWNVGAPGGVMADPKVGTRTEIQIHMGSIDDINRLTSSGCLAIPPSQHPQFVAHLRELIKERGSASLAIYPSEQGKPHEFRFLSRDELNKFQGKRISADEAVSNFKSTGDVDRKQIPYDQGSFVSPRGQQYASGSVLNPSEFYGGDPQQLVTGGGRSFNPGNVKFSGSKWQLENLSRYSVGGTLTQSQQKDEGQNQIMFSNPVAGSAGATRLAMMHYSQGRKTLREFISAYTPSYPGAADNIAKIMGISPNQDLMLNDPKKMIEFQKALYKQEVGPQTYNAMGGDSMAEQGVMLAFKNDYEKVFGGKPPSAQAIPRSNIAALSDLRIKSAESTAGGESHLGVTTAARSIQGMLGERLTRFTAFNDAFHQNRNSLHKHGLAGDFTIAGGGKASPMAVKELDQMFRNAGLRPGVDYKIIDEYNNPSSGATGGHIHYEFKNKQAAQNFHDFTAASEAKSSQEQNRDVKPGQPTDNRMAMAFSTEKPLDVAETIKKSGLKAEQNIIGVDVQKDEKGKFRSPEQLKTLEAAEKAGAKVHLYHQGPGMKEFGENSKGWEDNLKRMLSERRSAYSYEIDNLDQLKTPEKQLEFIRSMQEWQKQNNLGQKLTLKNATPELMKMLGENKSIDRSLISQFQIQEQNTGPKTGGEPAEVVKQRVEAGKQLGLTPVITGDTRSYQTQGPVLSEPQGVGGAGAEVKQTPVPGTAKQLEPPTQENQKVPEEKKVESTPDPKANVQRDDVYERAHSQSRDPQSSMGSAGASINPFAQTPGSHFALYGGGIQI